MTLERAERVEPAGRRESVLPVLPVKTGVLYPQLLMPLSIGRTSSMLAAEAAAATDQKYVIVAAQRVATVEAPGLADLYPLATRAVLRRMERGDGGMEIAVLGLERVRLLAQRQHEPFLAVEYEFAPVVTESIPELEALDRIVTERAAAATQKTSPFAEAWFQQALGRVEDPLHRAYLVAATLGLDRERQYELFAADSTLDALRLLSGFLTRELRVLDLRDEIVSKTQSEVTQQQREHMLRQQLRTIQEELGDSDPEKAALASLRERLLETDLPEETRAEVERELGRLERLSSASPDYQVTRSHLEFVADLPWGKVTEDVLDLAYARRVLDEDHHGLADVKERIVEHLAVLKLNPRAKAPILCFVGPPGVGKTSLGQSIARAMGRHFERISLGGVHDEAELRGHRRTYIGAMPGRVLQSMRRAGVCNPLLMLDEVDKLGQGFHGDPAAALLEILDPAQNSTFRDTYLDLPFDLSRVLFITTANTLDVIPQPLLDRMEPIRIAGYSEEEKAEIARRYLIPRQMAEAGLADEALEIPAATLQRIIRRYTREAGVRQLERRLANLCRKIALRIAEGKTGSLTIAVEQLPDFIGPERFFEEDARKDLPPGVVAGLAWTPAGGEVLYVETLLLPRGSDLLLTGQLGDVMRESVRTAHSLVLSHESEWGLDPERCKRAVHVHVPAGATPKDGPSAGVAMAVALASLYADQPARSDTAMTGEITLSGLVLPVGGIKEKVLAAHRAGMRRVVLPRQNARDLVDVPAHVQAALELVFADRIHDAVAAVIPTLRDALLSPPSASTAP